MNTDNTVEVNTPEERCDAFVYTHTFSSGAVYFGNGVNPNRPYKQGGRGPQYIEQFALDSNPLIEIVARNLTPKEADQLEQDLFYAHIRSGGIACQQTPCNNWLQQAVLPMTPKERKKLSQYYKKEENRNAINAWRKNVAVGVRNFFSDPNKADAVAAWNEKNTAAQNRPEVAAKKSKALKKWYPAPENAEAIKEMGKKVSEKNSKPETIKRRCARIACVSCGHETDRASFPKHTKKFPTHTEYRFVEEIS